MKVAVIILNYNSSDDCRKCVSFLKQQEGIELELVLVDNCSSDSDKVEVLCREQNCTFITSPENRGYNAGNNIGLRYAAEKGYKYALIANPDMEFPQTDYIKRLVEVMEQDENVVVVGSDIIHADGFHQNPIKPDRGVKDSYNWIFNKLKKHKGTKTYDENTDDYRHSKYCQKLSGCCFLISLKFAKKIGFFDEHVFLFCEEAILSKQVLLQRKKMFYVATTIAKHQHIRKQKKPKEKQLKQWLKSRLYFEKKYNTNNIFQYLFVKCLWVIRYIIIKSK